MCKISFLQNLLIREINNVLAKKVYYILCIKCLLLFVLTNVVLAVNMPLKLSISNEYSKLNTYYYERPHKLKASVILLNSEAFPSIYYSQSPLFEIATGYLLNYSSKDFLFRESIFPRTIFIKSRVSESVLRLMLFPGKSYTTVDFGQLFSISYLFETFDDIRNELTPGKRNTLSFAANYTHDLFCIKGAINIAQYSAKGVIKKNAGTGINLSFQCPYKLAEIQNHLEVTKIIWNWDKKQELIFRPNEIYLNSFFSDFSNLRNKEAVDTIYFANRSTIRISDLEVFLNIYAYDGFSKNLLSVGCNFQIDKHLSIQTYLQKNQFDFNAVLRLNIFHFSELPLGVKNL